MSVTRNTKSSGLISGDECKKIFSREKYGSDTKNRISKIRSKSNTEKFILKRA